MHEKVDGYEVGQHFLVARLLKGVFSPASSPTTVHSYVGDLQSDQLPGNLGRQCTPIYPSLDF